jgi:chromosome segregation protein
MSRLKELRLHGFKTFAEPTRFAFEPGVNAVIGPNGSGKSNMADAVRWVLGEQSNRSLRTRRADDVIFAGSEHRKPLGLAEVTLTLDNADGWLPIDYAEVTVGRRAFRNGEGEYLINGTRSRLRDVVELLAHGRLAANELIVVGQGTVDAALSLRPEERRQLFEDAAGVKTLQVRKNEGLARLAAARDNLVRVADLIGELRPQVRRLAVQAQHQQEHDALGRRARALVLEAYRRREQALRSLLGDARRRAAAAEATLEAARAQARAGREALAAAEARYWEAEGAARAAAIRREATREATIRADAPLEALHARREDLAALVTRDEAELASIEETLASREPDAEEAVIELRERAAEAERRWQAAIAQLAAADGAMLAGEERLATARKADAARLTAEADMAESQAATTARRVRLETDLASAVETEAQAAEEERGSAVTADRLARAASEAQERHGAVAASVSAAHAAAEKARSVSTQLAERVAVLQAELAALDERSTRDGRLGQRLTEAGWRAFLDDVMAPEEAWPAIEAVIGGELADALVWRNEDPIPVLLGARGQVHLLDRRRPPGAQERRAALRAVDGSRTLAEWLGNEAAHGELMPGLFERVAIAPSVDSLVTGWGELPPGWCAVTADGDLADGRGILALRGRADPPGGAQVRQRVQRRELGAELVDRERAYSASADEAAHAVAAAAAAQRQLAAARGEWDATQEAARLAQTDARMAAGRLAAASAEITRITEELAVARDLEARATAGGDAKNAGMGDASRATLESAARDARSIRESAAAEREASRVAWLQARERADDAERRAGAVGDRAAIEGRRTQLFASLAARRAAVEAADSELGGAELAARTHTDEDEVAGAARASADSVRDRLREDLQGGERGLGDASAQIADLERTAQATEIEASRHDEALAALGREQRAAIESLGDLDPDGDAPDADLAGELAGLDDGAVDAEMRRVRRLLGQIGSVNPFAVEEHGELSSRLEEIASQEGDLQAAIGSIEDLVGHLDREISERFGIAFAAIGERFDEFVKLLFAGGSANLQLSDGQDGETAGGIEIVVRPPGKRLQRLAMLSGGERALTGVALLFAMLSVNPVPFCILDEVDAALDEANITRFADALRRLSEVIDFVVITHNRATIEVADTIYGVTMSDAAVSRIVSLRLGDVPAAVIA